MHTTTKGLAGEVLAARFLREKGYTILSSNYHSRFGEIDIIANDGPYIVFVEVKARSEGSMILPREASRAKSNARSCEPLLCICERTPRIYNRALMWWRCGCPMPTP